MSDDSETKPSSKNEDVWKIRNYLFDLHQKASCQLEIDRRRWRITRSNIDLQLAGLREYTYLTKEWTEFMTLPDNIFEGQIQEGIDYRISLILTGVKQGYQLAKDTLEIVSLPFEEKHEKWASIKGNLWKLNLFFKENLSWKVAGFEIGEPLFGEPAVKCYRHIHHFGQLVFQLSFHKKILHTQNFLENKLNLVINYNNDDTEGERCAFLQHMLIEKVLPRYIQGIRKGAQRGLSTLTEILLQPKYAVQLSA